MDEIVKTNSEWNVVAENIMFALINRGEPFSADAFYSKAIGEAMPPSLIKKFSGAMFRQFQGVGYIRKRADYILSQRNGAACLPLWENAQQKK
jgi:phosphodiesterase/alkaline phosphatase D-like protein